MQGYIFNNLLFWKIGLNCSTGFSLQAVMCFLHALVLKIFTVGLKFLSYDGKICMFVAILTLFHSVFLLWISFLGSVFGCSTARHPYSANIVNYHSESGWIYVLSWDWHLLGHIKATELCGGNQDFKYNISS